MTVPFPTPRRPRGAGSPSGLADHDGNIVRSDANDPFAAAGAAVRYRWSAVAHDVPIGGQAAMHLDREVWIGLVEVKPRPSVTILGGYVGAIVNALAWISSESEYATAVGDG